MDWDLDKDHLHCHHRALLVFVILGFVLSQPRFRPAHFSTYVARPWNPFYMGFRVTLEVCLREFTSGQRRKNLLCEEISLWFLRRQQFCRRQYRSTRSHSCRSLTLRSTEKKTWKIKSFPGEENLIRMSCGSYLTSLTRRLHIVHNWHRLEKNDQYKSLTSVWPRFGKQCKNKSNLLVPWSFHQSNCLIWIPTIEEVGNVFFSQPTTI